MQISLSNTNNDASNLVKDLISDVLGSPQQQLTNNASFRSENPINNIEETTALAHQVLGQKMTQVSLVV
jgi:hypothetical protein